MPALWTATGVRPHRCLRDQAVGQAADDDRGDGVPRHRRAPGRPCGQHLEAGWRKQRWPPHADTRPRGVLRRPERTASFSWPREARPVHDVPGDLSPLIIGQHPVLRGGADRTVPDGPAEAARSEGSMGLLEQPDEPAEIAAAVRSQRRLQLGRVPPSGDKMRIGVLLTPPRPEQVVDQPSGTLSARIAELPITGVSCGFLPPRYRAVLPGGRIPRRTEQGHRSAAR